MKIYDLLDALLCESDNIQNIASPDDLDAALSNLTIPDDFEVHAILNAQSLFSGEWADVANSLITEYDSITGRIDISDSNGFVLFSFNIIH